MSPIYAIPLLRPTARAVVGGLCLWLAAQVSAERAFAGAIIPSRPEITLSGQPAPAPSSEVCGWVLVARDTGPQIALTERPATAVLSLEPGEEAQIAIPAPGLDGEVIASAQVTVLGTGEGEVTLAWNDEPGQRQAVRAGTVRLTIAPPAHRDGAVLRLRAKAAASALALRWHHVRLWQGTGEIALPLSPGAGNVDACPPRVLPPMRPPIEQALIEWDWRMQDGIDTERAASTFPAAVERLLGRGEALIQDLQAAGVDLTDPRRRWQQLREQQRQLLAATSADDEAWENLWQKAHRLRREIVFRNPLTRSGPLAFIKQVPSMFSHQLTQYYGSCARPGGGVYVLEAPGQSMTCRPLAADPGASYQHLEVSHEGDRLLFAKVDAPTTPKDREEHLERFYHLHEIAADGSGLRSVTTGPYDDFAPRYLPDGRILFISTRRGGFHRCGRGPCAVYTLAVCEADGSQARTLSFHETHEWDPSVMDDGRIVYTRWDYVDRHAVYYQQLWSARLDGSDVRAFYGNNTFNPVGVWETRPVPGSTRLMATAGAHHAMTAGSIILLDTTRGLDGPAPITRLTPDALFPESEAPVVQNPQGFWEAPLREAKSVPTPPEAARWPGHCYRTPCPLSETYFYAAYSYAALIGEPTWNRANMFGLYLVDVFGNKELVYRDLNIASLWPTPLRARPRPPQTAAALDPDLKDEGTFFMQNVNASWPALPRDLVTRLRIVQVLPKSTPHANTPTVGLANASPGKQVLGTVPVEADGSAYFRAPARIALAFQALDASGQAVQVMRSLTYLQPGERASCIGCHEPRSMTPPVQASALALRRAPSRITPGPDGSNPLSYPLLVQPVLDRHCVSCHQAARAEGKVILTGEPQGHYTVSYNALAPRVSYSDWAGRPGDFREVNHEPLSVPDYFGARGSKLTPLLRPNHYGVNLTPDDFERLATWMDANALFYGTFDMADQARQQAGQRIEGPKIQ